MFDIDDLEPLKALLSSASPRDGRPGGVTRGHHAHDGLRRGVGRAPGAGGPRVTRATQVGISGIGLVQWFYACPAAYASHRRYRTGRVHHLLMSGQFWAGFPNVLDVSCVRRTWGPGE